VMTSLMMKLSVIVTGIDFSDDTVSNNQSKAVSEHTVTDIKVTDS